MTNIFPDGVWPVMLTPFTGDNQVDYNGLKKLGIINENIKRYSVVLCPR